jgi:adenylate cyclase
MRVHLQSLFSISPVSLTLVTIFVVVMLYVSGTPILDLIELKTYDLRLLSRGQMRPFPAVVLAVIDEKSLATEWRWPWPRSRVIGFDMAFLEPDENSQNDLALANAMQQSSAAVVLGYFFFLRPADLDSWFEQPAIDQQLRRISAAKYPSVLYRGHGTDLVPFLRAYALKSNLEMFTAATAFSGYLSLLSDQDDVARLMPLIVQGGEELFPPLAVWCAWHYLEKPSLTVQVGRYGVEGIQMGNRFIPTDKNGQLLINYLGPPKTFPHVSISDILGGKLPRGMFTDQIVLVGATAVGTHDLLSTPLGPLYPALEVHATVIDNILTQNFLTRPTWSKTYDLLAIITLGVLIGIALPLPGGRERMLFVDDEAALVHLWQAALEHLGYSVVVCTSSLKALDVFRAAPQSFDLVITDYTMPTMTGEVLAHELRRIRPDIPIILYTGLSDTMVAERARALGINAFVLKPVRVRDLNLAIRQVLAQRMAQET